MSEASLIEISKSAIKNNIQFIQQYVGEKVKISSVVKSNAYGHGFETFVPVVKEAGIHHFSVFSSSEAKKIEPLLTNEDSIMIMGYVVEEDYEWVIGHNIELFVYEPQHLRIILETAKKLKKGQKNLTISVSSFGELSSLLNYELLPRLPLDIKRIIVN